MLSDSSLQLNPAALLLLLSHAAAAVSAAGGDSLGEAFIYCAVGMFNYKTDLQGIAIDPDCTKVVAAEGALVAMLRTAGTS